MFRTSSNTYWGSWNCECGCCIGGSDHAGPGGRRVLIYRVNRLFFLTWKF